MMDQERGQLVILHSQADGQLLAARVARVLAIIDNERDVGVHNDSVNEIRSLISAGNQSRLSYEIAKAILQIAGD